MLSTDVNIIDSTHDKFESYSSNQTNDLVIDKSKVAFAVKQDSKIVFFCEIFNCSIDIISFSNFIRAEWERVTEKLREFRHSELTYQLLEVTSPK